MKKLIYLSLFCLLCSFQQVKSQETNPVKGKIDSIKVIGYGSTINFIGNYKTDGAKPIVILNDKIIEYNLMNTIDPNKIHAINVLRDSSALSQYGIQAKNGVIIISTKDYVPQNSVKVIGYGSTTNIIGNAKADKINPLVVLNDEIIEYTSINTIDPNKISTVTILKDVSAIAEYGEEGKNGVIIISTKDYVPKKKTIK